MDKLLELDRQLLLWLNSFHLAWLDPLVLFITKTVVWIPLFLFLAYLIFKNFGKDGWKVLAGAGLAILLADRITSGLMKPFFARLRPSHEPALKSVLHLVEGYTGGLYGFASGHAANTVAVAVLMWLVFRNKYQKMVWIFLWAALMCYTRIYLGVHYPGDIVVGALVGALCGWTGFAFYRWLGRTRS